MGIVEGCSISELLSFVLSVHILKSYRLHADLTTETIFSFSADSQNTFNDDFGNNFANYTKIANVPLNINPMADTFNVAQNVRQWIENGLYTIANSTSNPTCVGVQVESILNSADVDAIVKDVGLLRNASSVFYLIDQYIANISDTILALVPPSDQCANALLKLTCSKCQQSISKLCRNVCGAAAKGCLAPYYTVLNPQFNILWDVTSQLVQFLNKTLTDMFAKQDAIKQALVRQWSHFLMNLNQAIADSECKDQLQC